MRTPMIEIGGILGQDLAQVTLIEDDVVIQTLGSLRPHPALGDHICAGCSEQGADLPDAEPTYPPINHDPLYIK